MSGVMAALKHDLTTNEKLLREVTFKACGFVPPVPKWTKQDRRGPTYGSYEVENEGNGLLCVRSLSAAGQLRYAMTMDMKSFERWAKDCT